MVRSLDRGPNEIGPSTDSLNFVASGPGARCVSVPPRLQGSRVGQDLGDYPLSVI